MANKIVRIVGSSFCKGSVLVVFLPPNNAASATKRFYILAKPSEIPEKTMRYLPPACDMDALFGIQSAAEYNNYASSLRLTAILLKETIEPILYTITPKDSADIIEGNARVV